MVDVVPIKEQDSKYDEIDCDSCGIKSKYMFHILDCDSEGRLEIDGEYCFRCVTKAYWSKFPKMSNKGPKSE